MNYYAGIDVSLEESCICVIDANGKVVRKGRFRANQQAPTRSIEFQKLLLHQFALRSAWRASPGLRWLAMHRPERRSPHPDQAAQGLRVQKS
jgi:transposase